MIPDRAAWCSLCHVDLRPATAAPALVAMRSSGSPQAQTLATDPLAYAPVSAGGRTSRRARSATPRGRHSAGALNTPAPPAPGDARAPAPDRGVMTQPDDPCLEVTLAEASASLESRAMSAHTDQWANQVLAELRQAEPGLVDPESTPGGKWGMAAMGTTAVIVVLLLVYTLLGVVIGR